MGRRAENGCPSKKADTHHLGGRGPASLSGTAEAKEARCSYFNKTPVESPRRSPGSGRRSLRQAKAWVHALGPRGRRVSEPQRKNPSCLGVSIASPTRLGGTGPPRLVREEDVHTARRAAASAERRRRGRAKLHTGRYSRKEPGFATDLRLWTLRATTSSRGGPSGGARQDLVAKKAKDGSRTRFCPANTARPAREARCAWAYVTLLRRQRLAAGGRGPPRARQDGNAGARARLAGGWGARGALAGSGIPGFDRVLRRKAARLSARFRQRRSTRPADRDSLADVLFAIAARRKHLSRWAGGVIT